MSYRFVFGASGAGKSYIMKEEMIQRSRAALDHFALAENDLYIVPDQYTMQSQKDLVLASGEHGILNIDVLSFGRISHRVFEELGAPERTPLDDIGKSLILRRVAASIGNELEVLGKRMGRPGMVSQVKSMISEFMQYDLDVAAVRELSAYAASNGQRALAARLADLARLYEAFVQYEQNRYITGEETLDLLAEMIPESRWLRDSVIVFDGFTGFTPVQYRVVKALLQTAREVTFVLTMGDDGGPTVEETLQPDIPIDPQDLFYLTRHTVRSIMRVAQEAGALHGEDIDLTHGCAVPLPRFARNPALAHFERALFRYPVQQLPSANGRIQIYEASNPEEEVRELCIRICRLVRKEGIAYRDCSIVCGDLAAYEDALIKMAGIYGLPIYLDRKQAVRRNPLTESIRAALEVTSGDYSYNTMFRYLRAGLSALTLEEIDQLENYVLAHGICTKKHWSTPFEEESAPEAMRQIVMGELAPLMELRGKTAGERTRALYAYLVGVHARERLCTYADRFAREEDLVRRQEYEQVYRAVIHLLDQIYELIGEDEITAADYMALLKTGFEEMRLGILPQQADRILAGDIERSRMPGCKVLFFLGANDGNVPAGKSKGGLISDLDREFLAESDTELAPTPREQMYLQRMYLYLNLTKASERLVISYAQTQSDRTSIRPSYLVSTIRQMYGDLNVELPERIETASSQADRLVGSADTMQYLALGIRQFADGLYEGNKAAADSFLTVYGYVVHKWPEIMGLTNAAFRNYRGQRISKETAEGIYGQILSGSVTRLETAARCFLRYYLQYGLRLQEREERRFEARDAGEILHQSIQCFSEMVRDRGMDWQQFTREEGEALADEALLATISGYEHELAHLDARTEGAVVRLRRILHRTVAALQYQIRHGEFTPTLFEEKFSGTGAMRFELSDHRELRLTGRIDRVDLCERDGRIYVKIIDYKSGSKEIDLAQIAAGLQLQLPLYLDAEMDVQKGLHPDAEIVPAGMLYYRFQDPILSGKQVTAAIGSWIAEAYAMQAESAGADDETAAADVPMSRCIAAEEAIYKALRPHGRVNSDPAVLELLDKTHEQHSMVIPISYAKGGLAASSKVFSQEEFGQMVTEMRETIRGLGNNILDGEIKANPVILDARSTACTYCPYREVCGFDRKLPGYEFRTI